MIVGRFIKIPNQRSACNGYIIISLLPVFYPREMWLSIAPIRFGMGQFIVHSMMIIPIITISSFEIDIIDAHFLLIQEAYAALTNNIWHECWIFH